MQKTGIPSEIEYALSAIETLAGAVQEEDLAKFRKSLPVLASKLAQSGLDVTEAELIEHAQIGHEHIEFLVKQHSKPKKKKKLSYDNVVGSLNYSQKQLDQNLFEAVYRNKIDEVKEWLKQGANPSCEDFHGNIIQRAHGNKNLEILDLLLEYADPEEMKKPVYLEQAFNSRNRDVITRLLDFEPEISPHLFRQACGAGDIWLAHQLIIRGADIDSKDEHYNRTALFSALHNGNDDIAKLLIDYGAAISNVYESNMDNLNKDILEYIIKVDKGLAEKNITKLMSQHITRNNLEECKFFTETCGLSTEHLDDEFKAALKNLQAWGKLNLDPMDFIDNQHSRHYLKVDEATYNKIATDLLDPEHRNFYKMGHDHYRKLLENARKTLGNAFDPRRTWQEHMDCFEKEQKHIIDSSPLRQLYAYPPYHADMGLVLGISDMLGKEGYTKGHGSALQYAYHAAALFKTEQRVLEYLQKWGTRGKQPLHDVIHQIKIPKSGRPNLSAWGDAVLRHGPKMAKYVKFSDRLIEPMKDGSGGWSYTKTKDEVAQYAFKRGPENAELAKHCLEFAWDDHQFETALKQIEKFQKKFSQGDLPKPANDNIKGGAIPDITIKGEDFDKDGYTFRKLADGDYRGLLLGEFTDCCQHIGSNAQSCAIHGYLSPFGGFYVVENDKTKEIVGQTWAWRGEEGELVFDSWESLKGHFNGAQCEKLCKIFAEQVGSVAQEKNITAFNVGTGGETPKMKVEQAEKPARPKDYKGHYYDSDRQYQFATFEINPPAA